MPVTDKGIPYPDGTWTFPPGLGEPGGAFETMAKGIDLAIEANSFVKIQALSLTVDSAYMTFSDIPSNFGDLLVIWGGRCDNTASTGFQSLNFVINGINSPATAYYSGRMDFQYGAPGSIVAGVMNASTSGRAGTVGDNASGGWIHIPRYTVGISKDWHGWGTARSGTGQAATTRRAFQASGGLIGSSGSNVTSLRLGAGDFIWAAGASATLFGVPK